MEKLFDKSHHESEFEKMAYGLVRISYKLLGGDRMTLTYGTDVKIHGSEIHMVCHIKRNPGSHISGIAREIKVTRGAVSQIVRKLEKKKLVRKVENPDNKRILNLELTDKGEKAFKGHQMLHGEFNDGLKNVIKDYDSEQMELLQNFVKDLEDRIDCLIERVYSEDYFEKKNL